MCAPSRRWWPCRQARCRTVHRLTRSLLNSGQPPPLTSSSSSSRQELTISYIDLDLTRELRQDKLEESYAFRCTCARCRAPDADADVDSAAHLRRITCSCGGSLIPTPPGQERTVACNSCPLVVQRPNDGGDGEADALSGGSTTVV